MWDVDLTCRMIKESILMVSYDNNKLRSQRLHKTLCNYVMSHSLTVSACKIKSGDSQAT